MAKDKLVLGLDIGSSGVKLIQLKETRRRGEVTYSLQSFGMKPLPPEAIVDGALMNSTAIVQAVQELIGELKIKQKEVAIGVSGHSVIIKKIPMPRMTSEQLDEAIQWEAAQHIPFEIKDVNVDTQILKEDANEASGQMDVLLVAAKKDMINDYSQVITDAGLSAAVVDVDAFAVQNCFSANYEVPLNETIVLINAGAAVVNINIIANGVNTFTRDVTIGGNQFTEEIQKQMNVSYEEAEALKVGGGRGDADAVVPQDVERVMSQVAEQVAGEIQRSLDFYAGTAADATFTKVYLSGGSAKVPALFKTIETRVGVPVEILNPFKRIEIDNRKFDPAFIMDVAPQAAVAVGLALRGPGDKFNLTAQSRAIRINLLPVRAAAKRESGRQFLVASIGFVVMAALGSAYWWNMVDNEKQAAERKLADTQTRIDELEKKIGEVNNINKQKKEVEAKLDTLNKLRKQRGGPVKLLDALSTSIPKKVWIMDFSETGGGAALRGYGESHEDVSDFMKGLSNVVWTPKGMGRVLERKTQAATARVELLTAEGTIEDFAVADLGTFFSAVELKSSEVESVGTNKRVKFEITLSANYAI